MKNEKIVPDNTAVQVALYRAWHLEVDAKPYILEDDIGLKLIEPEDNWLKQPYMDPQIGKRIRGWMVARSRFIEDLVIEQNKLDIHQYLILGAGLDSFAQRNSEINDLQIFEIDQLDTQTWKQERLQKLGFGISKHVHFVPVDFEISSWLEELSKTIFNFQKSAVVTCTGVTMYLTKEATLTLLQQVFTLALGSKLAITFFLQDEYLEKEDLTLRIRAQQILKEKGTPFISFFKPEEILALASEAGFKETKIISTTEIEQLYFTNRIDGLLPASGEVFLVATV